MTAALDITAQQSAALALAARGLYVFPLDHPELPSCVGRHSPDAPCGGERGKHPTCRWSVDSTADADQVVNLFSRGARNIGVDCGRSQLLVLDEDAPGELDRACSALGVALPDTLMVSTGKGRHVYFRQPDGAPLSNGRGRFKDYRIDVRGRGGYVVGPGSLHASGRRYEVLRDSPVAPVPGWLSHALADIPPPRRAPAAEVPQPVADRAIVGALQVVLDAAPGSRNGRLFWAGCRLFERVHDARLEDGQAEEMLLAAAEAVGLSLDAPE